MLRQGTQSSNYFYKNRYRRTDMTLDHSIDYSVRGKSVQQPDQSIDYQSTTLNQSFSVSAQRKYRIKPQPIIQRTSTNRFSKDRYFERPKIIKNQQLNVAELLKKPPPKFQPYDLSKIPAKKYDYIEPFKLGEQNLERIIVQEGFNFYDRIEQYTYLPLSYFNDTTLDHVSDAQMAQRLKAAPIKAQMMHSTDSGQWCWIPMTVTGYDNENGLFDYRIYDRVGQCSRIEFVADFEDPYAYLDKLDKAFKLREQMDGLLRYNYYIDNMKTEGLLDVPQKNQERMLARLNLNFDIEFSQIENLLYLVQQDYYRYQNQMIFNKYLEDRTETVQNNTVIPQFYQKKTPYYGKLPLESDDGTQTMVVYDNGVIEYFPPRSFQDIVIHFNNLSLYSCKEVLNALAKVKTASNNILRVDLFYFRQKALIKVDEYKTAQESIAHKALNVIRSDWMNTVVNITKQELRVANRTSAVLGPEMLDRFFQILRMQLQDTLLAYVRKNLRRLVNFFLSTVPEDVKVTETVQNIYVESKIPSPDEIKNFDEQMFYDPIEEFFPFYCKPIFTINIILSPLEDELVYSYPLRGFQQNILNIIDKVLLELAIIQDPEPKLLDNYHKFSNKGYLKTPKRPFENPELFQEDKQSQENVWVWEIWQKINQICDRIIKPMQLYLQGFSKYKDILNQQSAFEEKSNNDEEVSIADIEAIRDLIISNKQRMLQLADELPDEIHVSIFQINLSETLRQLTKKLEQFNQVLIEHLIKRARAGTSKSIREFLQMQDTIKEVPKNIEKLVQLKEYINNDLQNEIEAKRNLITTTVFIYEILEEFQFQFRGDDVQKRWQMFGMPKQTNDLVVKILQNLEFQKTQLAKDQAIDQIEFRDQMDKIEQEINLFHNWNRFEQNQQAYSRVKAVNNQLQQFQEKAKLFNQREELLGKEITDYNKLYLLQKEFAPYSNLWMVCQTWMTNIDLWLTTSWESLDALSCEKFVTDGFRMLTTSLKHFRERNIPSIIKIAERMKDLLDEFRPKVPLMVSLKKPGMKDRHWEQISRAVGFEVKPDEDFNFSKVLDMGLMDHLQPCMEIGERASKEYNIECMLMEMKNIWSEMKFTTLSFKGSHILKGLDEIQATLDEHIMSTQSMQFSPYKKPFEAEIVEWVDQLKLISDVLEEWCKLQQAWMYLQPIFDSPDIAKQLPLETKRFRQIDKTFKEVATMCFQQVYVQKVCNSEGILTKLREANTKLEQVQKELNNYLEKKRERFARFYFLSNDDLLEILSQSKEPTAVQPHLKKVFENMHQIEFELNKVIVAMYSAEGEKVRFTTLVDPKGKNVEDWMGLLEDEMKSSVRYALLKSVEQYQFTSRSEWVVDHPGQCVLNGSQIVWTREVEDAISHHSLKDYLAQQDSQIKTLVSLLRSRLSKQATVTINALIVIDVHAKDVVDSLYEKGVRNTGEFEWIMQLRYYLEGQKRDLNCRVKCIQTDFPYGYEYLGNTLRLVITPLTDKCYMTLMGALQLNLGGAPAGPAGTGKTETTKDLAKALAKQCVVFNCSDSMDYLMLGKFFKGLASAGAWCCFDEFNRINIEVLSVIAQQLLILFGQKAIGSKDCQFEGSYIKINPTFCVFITMNPGYAGRTELPDNLKALFRSVAMMVPDYAMIGEIMLYSFGFNEGRVLAKKMVTTFKLCSEQLSSQDHYDYGMRAVRSVINAAGLLKQKEPDAPETHLLLKALKDVNVPKFLKDDIPLFNNIIKDLFPEIEQISNQSPLEQKIKKAIELQHLYPHPHFIDKCFQFYSTTLVRHGIMLVGHGGGGKTTALRVTAQAIELANDNLKVQIKTINPKSVTMGELYGQFNLQTQEWSDGVLANAMRNILREPNVGTQLHWLMLDGPVDSLWIESMNTVLDDNKKLCLNSGQMLTLTENVTMLFEVEDLLVASPATVSRCGMVYMESIAMGYKPLLSKNLHSSGLPRSLRDNVLLIRRIEEASIEYLDTYLPIVMKSKHILDSNEVWLGDTYCSILLTYLNFYKPTEIRKVTSEEIERLDQNIDLFVAFCLAWTLLLILADQEAAEQLNKSLIEKLYEKGLDLQIQNGDLLIDYDLVVPEFELRKITVSDTLPDSLQYHEILVPTVQFQAKQNITKLLLKQNYHVLLTGPTGVGKTVNCMGLLRSEEDIQQICITFSAQSLAAQTQDSIDAKLEKRRKGFYGPPIGKKCVIFIDDLNMPKKEEYGAQPAIELVRQFMDHQGWYNRKELNFMTIEDTVILSAMGPPGGGRTFVTNRLLRHYCVIGTIEFEAKLILNIFEIIVKYFIQDEQWSQFIPQMINSTIMMYFFAKNNLLPTPGKAHYQFNLRDVWRVLQGVCQINPKKINNTSVLTRLWAHETTRVFCDRLTNNEDRFIVDEKITEQTILLQEAGIDLSTLMYCDFENTNYKQDFRPYEEVSSIKNLRSILEKIQIDFNKLNRSTSLVFFDDAISHIIRIQRVIRLPQGNALLLGVGGSGRQSLSRLAAFISNQIVTQIELIKNYMLRNWRDDLRKALMMAGVNNLSICFLLVDTQIVHEAMLEDVCGVLNSGDVTNLYGEKEMDEIQQALRSDCIQKNIQPNKMNVFSEYLARVKKNIHIVVCMSPMNASFAGRLRMFPSLVNCSTIDWFTEWPSQALIGVGVSQLSEVSAEIGLDFGKSDGTTMLDQVVECLQYAHQTACKLSSDFKSELGRRTYFTSTSYIHLIETYIHIFKEKKAEYQYSLQRIRNGLNKLLSANEAVVTMKFNLQEMGPQLEKASEETQKMMVNLERDKAQAAETQLSVSKEEKAASIQQAEATSLAEKAQQSVAEANLLLDQTLQEVQKLKKDHLVEIKSLGQPPKPVRVILGGVVILNIDTVRKNGGEVIIKNVEGQLAKKEEDYFETAKRFLLNDPKDLLEMLKSYDKDNINPAFIYKLEQKIMCDPDFNLERAKQCSFAVKFLYSWVRAMYDYNKVYLETRPLRDKLAQTMAILDEKTAFLNEKKAQLDECNRKIKILQDLYDEKTQLMEDLKNKIIDCEVKLGRAEKLTQGLSEEQQRWAKDITQLEFKEKLLPGDAVVAVSMLCYSGAFSSNYRVRLEQMTINYLNSIEFSISKNIGVIGFLGTPVKIQLWNLYGLPKDETSIVNGVLMDKSKQWPLIIDPQNQANKFIKMLGKDHVEGLDVVKNSDYNYIKLLELAVQFGKMVLIENLHEDLDPALDPILNQKIINHDGQPIIQFGDKHLPYNYHFKLLMTTRLSNPNITPENFVKVLIVNFAITPTGLEEQMLAQIVTLENPQLEQRKSQIVQKNAEDSRRLVQIEDSILQALAATKGDISEVLKDETLINELQNSKRFAKEINKRVEDSKLTEIQIDEARERYRQLAYKASLLFFCISDLSCIDSMYQYSLQWFQQLFNTSVQSAPASNDFNERLANLSNCFILQLYHNICRSLFEKHKLIFSILLTVQLTQLDQKEWRHFLQGATGDFQCPINPVDWIDENSWPRIAKELSALEAIPQLQGLFGYFNAFSFAFRSLYDATELPPKILPDDWEFKLTEFQKILALKAFRPDLVTQAMIRWVSGGIGQQFVNVQTLSIGECFNDSSYSTPLIFILSPGSDPVKDFMTFAEEKLFQKRYQSISLGQGQGVKAEKLIKDGAKDGGWVLLQNCHLAASWMGELEKIVESLNEETHPDFRLWLTSMPAPNFPIMILQNGVKMTLEPPQGLRNNLLRTYKAQDQITFEQSSPTFKKLFLNLSLFHAIIQDRRKFGPIGWNIPYEFTNEDLWVSLKQVTMLLEKYQEVPFKVINYLCAEINYGGRVTDYNDQRLIKSILSIYVSPDALTDQYQFSSSGLYRSIPTANYEDYIRYIEQLPMQPSPEAFGLHDNAKIIFQENQTKFLTETVQLIQPSNTSHLDISKDIIVSQVISYIEKKVPQPFNIDEVFKAFPTCYEESMNTVLVQELIRYNRLICLVIESLETVKKALKGMIAMSDELETLFNNLFDNKVPILWEQRSFLSLKPLGSWSQDFAARVKFLQDWIQFGTPVLFWLPGFFFPQSFITATLQNFARKNIIAIDRLSFTFNFMDKFTVESLTEKPEDGVYVRGLFLEGARWNPLLHVLDSPNPKELFSDLPIIHLKPQRNYQKRKDTYDSPLYKVTSRAGTLSTTGHSTNFVMYLEMPTQRSPEFWVRGGVAAFLALNY